MARYAYNLKGTSYSVDLEETSQSPIADSGLRPRHPRRMRLLGILGELLAERLLEAAGFTGVRNLNLESSNYKDFDFTGERAGQRFLISVKARNKWQRSGRLNDRYKLESKCRKMPDAQRAAREQNAEAAWLTVQIDRQTYSAYFGTHDELATLYRDVPRRGKKPKANGVMMTEVYTRLYETLAENEPHCLPYDWISNRR